MEILLDKIRVCETIRTASKSPSSRRWVYQCRCWFALASGYDWSSLGGEGKITWTVITNKLGVEKQKKFCVKSVFFGWIFALWLNVFLKKLGKIRFNSVNSRKQCSINRKNWQSHKPQKWEKTEKRKNTDNICIWYTRYKYYALTKPASILISSYKSFVFVSNYQKMWVRFIRPVNSLVFN